MGPKGERIEIRQCFRPPPAPHGSLRLVLSQEAEWEVRSPLHCQGRGPAAGQPPAHIHGRLRILWPVLSLCPAPAGVGGGRSALAASQLCAQDGLCLRRGVPDGEPWQVWPAGSQEASRTSRLRP